MNDNNAIWGVPLETGLNKDELKNKVTSVNGKTGAVKLNAADVGALGKEELPTAINTALLQAKESGAFDGAPGKTPEKGVDYFTEADKAEIVEEVAESIDIVENPYLGTLLAEIAIPSDTLIGTKFDTGLTMGELRKYKEIYIIFSNASNSGSVSNHYLRAIGENSFDLLRWGGAGYAWLIKRGEYENPDVITVYNSSGNPSTAAIPMGVGAVNHPQQMANMYLTATRRDWCEIPDENELCFSWGTTNASVAATLKIIGIKEI